MMIDYTDQRIGKYYQRVWIWRGFNRHHIETVGVIKMNLIEKIKKNKQKQNQTFIKPEIVEVVIDSYEEIKEAVADNFSYEDIELALFNKTVEPFLIADICYIAGKVLEKYGTPAAPAQAEIETKEIKETEEAVEEKSIQQEEPKANNGNMNIIAQKASGIALNKYLKDKYIKGYAVVLCKNHKPEECYANWVISENPIRAYRSAYMFHHQRDKLAGEKNSYTKIRMKKMTYGEYLREFNNWADA